MSYNVLNNPSDNPFYFNPGPAPSPQSGQGPAPAPAPAPTLLPMDGANTTADGSQGESQGIIQGMDMSPGTGPGNPVIQGGSSLFSGFRRPNLWSGDLPTLPSPRAFPGDAQQGLHQGLHRGSQQGLQHGLHQSQQPQQQGFFPQRGYGAVQTVPDNGRNVYTGPPPQSEWDTPLAPVIATMGPVYAWNARTTAAPDPYQQQSSFSSMGGVNGCDGYGVDVPLNNLTTPVSPMAYPMSSPAPPMPQRQVSQMSLSERSVVTVPTSATVAFPTQYRSTPATTTGIPARPPPPTLTTPAVTAPPTNNELSSSFAASPSLYSSTLSQYEYNNTMLIGIPSSRAAFTSSVPPLDLPDSASPNSSLYPADGEVVEMPNAQFSAQKVDQRVKLNDFHAEPFSPPQLARIETGQQQQEYLQQYQRPFPNQYQRQQQPQQQQQQQQQQQHQGTANAAGTNGYSPVVSAYAPRPKLLSAATATSDNSFALDSSSPISSISVATNLHGQQYSSAPPSAAGDITMWAKGSGAPASMFNTFETSNLERKRRRSEDAGDNTTAHKKTAKNPTGRACAVCYLFHKPCKGGRPCDRCKQPPPSSPLCVSSRFTDHNIFYECLNEDEKKRVKIIQDDLYPTTFQLPGIELALQVLSDHKSRHSNGYHPFFKARVLEHPTIIGPFYQYSILLQGRAVLRAHAAKCPGRFTFTTQFETELRVMRAVTAIRLTRFVDIQMDKNKLTQKSTARLSTHARRLVIALTMLLEQTLGFKYSLPECATTGTAGVLTGELKRQHRDLSYHLAYRLRHMADYAFGIDSGLSKLIDIPLDSDADIEFKEGYWAKFETLWAMPLQQQQGHDEEATAAASEQSAAATFATSSAPTTAFFATPASVTVLATPMDTSATVAAFPSAATSTSVDPFGGVPAITFTRPTFPQEPPTAAEQLQKHKQTRKQGQKQKMPQKEGQLLLGIRGEERGGGGAEIPRQKRAKKPDEEWNDARDSVDAQSMVDVRSAFRNDELIELAGMLGNTHISDMNNSEPEFLTGHFNNDHKWEMDAGSRSVLFAIAGAGESENEDEAKASPSNSTNHGVGGDGNNNNINNNDYYGGGGMLASVMDTDLAFDVDNMNLDIDGMYVDSDAILATSLHAADVADAADPAFAYGAIGYPPVLDPAVGPAAASGTAPPMAISMAPSTSPSISPSLGPSSIVGHSAENINPFDAATVVSGGGGDGAVFAASENGLAATVSVAPPSSSVPAAASNTSNTSVASGSSSSPRLGMLRRKLTKGKAAMKQIFRGSNSGY